MLVTTISSRFCQRERVWSVVSLRVMTLEPTTSSSIKPQVNTMVPLSLKNPCCQKIISSGLRRMASLRCQARHDQSRHHKTEQTTHHALPVVARDDVKTSHRHAHP